MSIFKKYSYWVNSGKYTAIQKFSVLGMGIISFMLLNPEAESWISPLAKESIALLATEVSASTRSTMWRVSPWAATAAAT